MGSIVHKWFKEGKQEGKMEGFQEGIQRGKMEGIQEGMQKGIQRGKMEGIQEGILTVAKRMLKEKQDPDFIAQVTGLSKQQVLKLKSNI